MYAFRSTKNRGFVYLDGRGCRPGFPMSADIRGSVATELSLDTPPVWQRANPFTHFVTLTLDASRVDRYDMAAITRKLNAWLSNQV